MKRRALSAGAYCGSREGFCKTAAPAAGTPYTSTDSDSSTSVDSTTGQGNNQVDIDTDVITLTSDPMSSTVVPLGTYDCYHLTDTNTTVSPDSDGTTSTDTHHGRRVVRAGRRHGTAPGTYILTISALVEFGGIEGVGSTMR